ncbi:hypothetical protein ACIFOE_18285 [Paenibacillus sp. NRS-1783]|uniref:hypothetical protein n=1 Tax=Paenibacillus sp. NRS-1783 TaxID=3233907 RepID=UPI003D2911F3
MRSEYELARTSFFVYHPQNEIIVYEVNSSIKDTDFRVFFTKFLSKDHLIGEVKIKPVPEPYQIRTELESIQTITSVHFQLIHPNPGKKDFNLYNQIIHENKLKELDIKMVNNQGLQLKALPKVEQLTERDNFEPIILSTYIELDEIEERKQETVSTEESKDEEYTQSIENGIHLVESGYGSVEIKGFDIVTLPGKGKKSKKRKKKRTFSSNRSVRKITTNEYSQNGLITRILNFIIDVREKASAKGEADDNTRTFKQ